MDKSVSVIRKSLDNFNFATFLLASLGALAALWLNSNYVSQEVYEKDKEIIFLKNLIFNIKENFNTKITEIDLLFNNLQEIKKLEN